MRMFPLQFVEDQLDDMHSHLQFLSHSRWAVNYWLVFEVEGETWGVEYCAPATEYQEDQERFNEDNGMVLGFRMKEVPTTKWEMDL